MNFDDFLKRYSIEEFASYGFEVQSVVMDKETLINMLTDLYDEAYNDGISFKNVEWHKIS